jgi:hypothetical protein
MVGQVPTAALSSATLMTGIFLDCYKLNNVCGNVEYLHNFILLSRADANSRQQGCPLLRWM